MNGNSSYSNSNSFTLAEVASLPWVFRVQVPGWQVSP